MPVEAAGVDTWSVCWYLREGSSAERAMQSLATVRASRSRLLDESVRGHRVGWFPGSRLLFAEGHPGGEGALCKSHELPAAFDLLSEALADRGILPPARRLVSRTRAPLPENRTLGGSGFGGVRRLDSTVNLRFDSPGRGLAALAGVGSVRIPRVKTKVIREVGGRRVETVELRGSAGRTILGRWYDKGVESGLAERGVFVRPEDQRRFAKDARVPVDVVAQGTYIRDSFVKRFEPLWRSAKGVKVAPFEGLTERVVELVESGDMTPGEAKAALGHLVLDSGGRQLQSRATWYRDRAVCSRHGLALAEGVDDEVEVDLGEVIEEALESDCWGQG